MREILFRGKRIDSEEWVFGSLLIDGEAHKPVSKENLSFSKHYIVPETDRENIQTRFNDGSFYLNTIAYHVIPETIGQYTGLKDKKGNKIFEGDIVKFGTFIPGAEEYMGEVNWDYSLFDEYKYVWQTKCEVVGNIHDNIDLLI